MLEFIQSYGIWIFLGLLFPLMLWGRSRGHGMGCCGGGHQPEPSETLHRETDDKGTYDDYRSSRCH
jgi:hypothetical protein